MKHSIRLIILLALIQTAAAATFTVIAPDDGEDPTWATQLAAAIRVRQPGGLVLVLDVTTAAQMATEVRKASAVHFIGHVRGATLLGRLAALIPEVKIDQFTTIDPPAPAMAIPANVLFADNYYQNQATAAYTAGPLDGAFNLRLVFVGDGRGVPENIGLLNWYASTLQPGSTRGYFYTDCDHGVRPARGFGARRVGRPSFSYSYDAKARVLTQRFAGGASGVYNLEGSFDPQFRATTIGNGTIQFDGRPFVQTIPDFDAAQYPQIFFRLRSAGTVNN